MSRASPGCYEPNGPLDPPNDLINGQREGSVPDRWPRGSIAPVFHSSNWMIGCGQSGYHAWSVGCLGCLHHAGYLAIISSFIAPGISFSSGSFCWCYSLSLLGITCVTRLTLASHRIYHSPADICKHTKEVLNASHLTSMLGVVTGTIWCWAIGHKIFSKLKENPHLKRTSGD